MKDEPYYHVSARIEDADIRKGFLYLKATGLFNIEAGRHKAGIRSIQDHTIHVKIPVSDLENAVNKYGNDNGGDKPHNLRALFYFLKTGNDVIDQFLKDELNESALSDRMMFKLYELLDDFIGGEISDIY